MIQLKIPRILIRLYDKVAARVEHESVGYDHILRILESAQPEVQGNVEQCVFFNGRRDTQFLPMDKAIERFRAYYHSIGGYGDHNAYRVHHPDRPLLEHHIRFRRNPLSGHEKVKAGAIFIFRAFEQPNRNP
jgi:hypothetical protein